MRRFPFRKELEDLFRGDRSAPWKMAGAAMVTVFIVVYGGRKAMSPSDLEALSIPGIVAVIALAAIAGASLALALSLKDVVARRLAAGEPVNPILKVYFGLGLRSALIWIPTVILLTFGGVLVAALFLSLGSTGPGR